MAQPDQASKRDCLGNHDHTERIGKLVLILVTKYSSASEIHGLFNTTVACIISSIAITLNSWKKSYVIVDWLRLS